jgi:hypothetical protein
VYWDEQDTRGRTRHVSFGTHKRGWLTESLQGGGRLHIIQAEAYAGGTSIVRFNADKRWWLTVGLHRGSISGYIHHQLESVLWPTFEESTFVTP